ncbi:MAG: phosphoribosylformylglycinamidine synthase subunit PurQ [Melioribacteraceae bacterium]|nr:phosphoribosylformylglycinamidine synthase subunit PurQ [Melioribacteraceae bacterium]MCF8355445.1 phosphoribosylformylglycinamidine synthase subunit PurQ [Melioribacteraceae bacterium]MCF8395380.1 phosphoribosylformylglycinamidine synthase subunit PurQ [Melioribacteraceae bacterium]MCF8420473.1 phosphoribosylformylglycinamidine synthase subunit PurQ [Melioribacteraceae bacterium]
MKPKFGVVVFPGSNCDHDAYYAVKKVLGYDAEFLWHKDNDLMDSDIIILPGGFSYGDYLRTGSIARFSPIMNSVIDFANKGGTVIGICNGFQILLEAGLLPGVMLKNESLKFVCKDVYLKVNNKDSLFTNKIEKDLLEVPIAHGEGNYFADEDTLKMLEDNNQIAFKYSSINGDTDITINPNGSRQNIAGILNKNGNVLGMMPHPERACDPVLGKTDGELIIKSIVENFIN